MTQQRQTKLYQNAGYACGGYHPCAYLHPISVEGGQLHITDLLGLWINVARQLCEYDLPVWLSLYMA